MLALLLAPSDAQAQTDSDVELVKNILLEAGRRLGYSDQDSVVDAGPDESLGFSVTKVYVWWSGGSGFSPDFHGVILATEDEARR
jgi:hypothetical protein